MVKRVSLTIFLVLAAAGMGSVSCDDEGTGGSGASGTVTSTSSGPGGTGGTGGATTSGTGAAGGAGGVGGVGGAGGAGGAMPLEGVCAKACTTPADCCQPNQPNCPSDQYPTNFTCDNGICGPPQCAIKEDCTAGGQLPEYDCIIFNGANGCVQPCVADGECMGTALCTGLADDMSKFCEVEIPPLVCQPGESCNGFGVCNAAGNACGCSDDAQCSNNFVNKCVK